MSNYSTTYDPPTPACVHTCCNDFEMGGSNFNTCLKNFQTGAWYNLYFYFTKEVDGKGGGMTAIAALWMMDLAVVVMR